MITQTDTEMTVTKKEVCYTHKALETGGVAHCAGPHGVNQQAEEEAEEVGRKMQAKAFSLVSMQKNGQGRGSSFRIG